MFFNVLVADFNREGWLDLFAVAYTYDDKPETLANSSVIFFGSSSGFSPKQSTVVPTYCGGNARLADVNKDGWAEIIFYDSRGYLSIYLGGPQGYSPQRMSKVPLEVCDATTTFSVNDIPSVTCADLNEDDWIDLIVPVMGHYVRQESGLFILSGGPDGFSRDRTQFHALMATGISVSVADLNRDGHLDLLVPAYSTQYTRELPAHIFWGNGKAFEFAKPFTIRCDSSCAFMAVDITGNGYLDLLTICHRNDLGHQVDSLLFWNGPEGLRQGKVARLPGLGPHLSSSRDFGNALTREPLENYISPAYDAESLKPIKISWKAETSQHTGVKIQLRGGDSLQELESAAWNGPAGTNTFYDKSGQEITAAEKPFKWLQYKATLISTNGCRSPKLEEVRLDFLPIEQD